MVIPVMITRTMRLMKRGGVAGLDMNEDRYHHSARSYCTADRGLVCSDKSLFQLNHNKMCQKLHNDSLVLAGTIKTLKDNCFSQSDTIT